MERGDHLISPRTGYSHHGLYLGRNKVIHYTGFSHGRHKGVIAITSLAEFCQGESFTVQIYPFRLYSHEESAQRALTRLGEDWYDILLNNCEHFVTWCILGIHHSQQVSRLVTVAESSRKLLTAPEPSRPTTVLAGQVAQQAITTSLTRQTGPVVGTTAGTLAGSGLATSAGVTTALAGVTAASAVPLAAALLAGTAVGVGVKKLTDWFSAT